MHFAGPSPYLHVLGTGKQLISPEFQMQAAGVNCFCYAEWGLSTARYSFFSPRMCLHRWINMNINDDDEVRLSHAPAGVSLCRSVVATYHRGRLAFNSTAFHEPLFTNSLDRTGGKCTFSFAPALPAARFPGAMARVTQFKVQFIPVR